MAKKTSKNAPIKKARETHNLKVANLPSLGRDQQTEKEVRQWVQGMKALNYARYDAQAAGVKVNMGNAMREHAMARPERKAQAARNLPHMGGWTGTKSNTPERTAEVNAWLGNRPKGGGRGVAAAHSEWVAWGRQNPNRASMASHALSGRQWTGEKPTYKADYSAKTPMEY